jgi:hypothetical protein
MCESGAVHTSERYSAKRDAEAQFRSRAGIQDYGSYSSFGSQGGIENGDLTLNPVYSQRLVTGSGIVSAPDLDSAIKKAESQFRPEARNEGEIIESTIDGDAKPN